MTGANRTQGLIKEPVKKEVEEDEDVNVKRPPSAIVIQEGDQTLIKVPPILKGCGLSNPLQNVIPSMVSLGYSANWHIDVFSKGSRQKLNSAMREHCPFLHETRTKGRMEIIDEDYMKDGMTFSNKPLVLIAFLSVYHYFTSDSIIINHERAMNDLKSRKATERARSYIGVFSTLFEHFGRQDWNNSEDKAKKNVENTYSCECDAEKLKVTRGKEHEALRIHSSGTTA